MAIRHWSFRLGLDSSVKKKMAELEVELLHCKQERDIPEVAHDLFRVHASLTVLAQFFGRFLPAALMHHRT
jgi:hypothetical protein